MKLITREWLTFAQKDVASCERLLGDEFLTNVVAFHAQQAVEKCLKALVEEFEVGFIKTHDLIKLYGSVASYLDFELDLDMLKKLNEVYVDARYPGEFGLLPYTGPTLADAQSFYEFARDFLTKVQEQLEESRST